MITVDFNFLQVPVGGRVLDIGCGSGRHVAAAYALEKAMVVGADANYEDLTKARSRLQYHDQLGAHGNGCWSLAASDINHLPFMDATFDLVICSEVLEHVPDHHGAMAEIVRVLKPGSLLVVSVPRRWPEALCWRLSSEYRCLPGGHIRIYKADQLLRQVQSHGVRHLHTHFAHSLHSPFWWLKCLVGVQREEFWPVRWYHRFLVWDMMQKPRLTRTLERWFNPFMGKSVVFYFRKTATAGERPAG
jgi:SAM-dependent methyltransferase